jgi:hypothetical protein
MQAATVAAERAIDGTPGGVGMLGEDCDWMHESIDRDLLITKLHPQRLL